MESLRSRLTYANVVSSLALFLVVAGGAAFAASKVARKVGHRTVGTPQLKAGAVTTTKIRANAITTRKLKREAISNAKLKAASVNVEKIDLTNVPFGRVVARLRGTQGVVLETEPKLYPLAQSTYTQAADEVDSLVGAVDVSFPAGCKAPREATAFIVVDGSEPLKAKGESVALGEIQDKGSKAVTKRIQIGPSPYNGVIFEPGAPKSHTVSLVVTGACEVGSTEKPTATAGAVDVLGTR